MIEEEKNYRFLIDQRLDGTYIVTAFTGSAETETGESTLRWGYGSSKIKTLAKKIAKFNCYA